MRTLSFSLKGSLVLCAPRRSPGCLRLIQEFLGMPKDLFTADTAMLPARFEQKRVELLVYKLLNHVDSPAARMKVGNAVFGAQEGTRLGVFRLGLGVPRDILDCAEGAVVGGWMRQAVGR